MTYKMWTGGKLLNIISQNPRECFLFLLNKSLLTPIDADGFRGISRQGRQMEGLKTGWLHPHPHKRSFNFIIYRPTSVL